MTFLCTKKCIFAAKYFKYYEEQKLQHRIDPDRS